MSTYMSEGRRKELPSSVSENFLRVLSRLLSNVLNFHHVVQTSLRRFRFSKMSFFRDTVVKSCKILKYFGCLPRGVPPSLLSAVFFRTFPGTSFAHPLINLSRRYSIIHARRPEFVRCRPDDFLDFRIVRVKGILPENCSC